MNILIVTDKFKDALPALAVAEAMEKGLHQAIPDAKIDSFPLADGGEGSLAAWLALEDATAVTLEVMDPLFRPIKARYGLSRDGKTAFVEMAQASGLELLHPKERRCWDTSTFGTGQLVKHALSKGVERIILSAGGSATVDGGMGMAEALGFHFLDDHGRMVPTTGGNLAKVRSFDTRKVHPHLKAVRFEVWTDVLNPLTGPEGAAFNYAKQKGATPEQIVLLDKGLAHFSELTRPDLATFPGAGAGGGLAFGAAALLGADIRPGLEQFLAYPSIRDAFTNADCVITGEGRLDRQTRYGKLVHGVCQKARERSLPVIALCGSVESSSQDIADMGLLAAFSILRNPGTLTETVPHIRQNIEETARNVGKVLSFFSVG